MLDWVENKLLPKGLENWALLFPVYKLSREKTLRENMCDIVFEKVKGRAGKVNRTSVSAEAAVRRVL